MATSDEVRAVLDRFDLWPPSMAAIRLAEAEVRAMAAALADAGRACETWRLRLVDAERELAALREDRERLITAVAIAEKFCGCSFGKVTPNVPCGMCDGCNLRAAINYARKGET